MSVGPRPRGRATIALPTDVTSKEQVEAMVAQAASQLGGLHILVNSGSSPGGSTTATGPIETVVDEDLLKFDLIWAAAGTPNAVFSTDPRKLVAGIRGEVMTVVVRKEKA